ncbi:MAG: hypothetical protein CME63_09095 [Halobacteriovoraceae bacterium]|nr:hypothetical protein [Halobacteriovoraceae bacterium]|tara:strand:- start:86055 stop:86495 length:441 start_codon:yes stop_codon:yes gene_type:complete
MRTLEQWLDAYSKDHQNPTNKKIHHICVPLIMFSLLGLLWAIPTPSFFILVPYLNWSTLFSLLALFFYISLNIKVALIMLINVTIQYFLIIQLEKTPYLIPSCVTIFILAWIGQFIGHKIEGQKPSFLTDLQFLLIGPLWVFQKLF